MTYAASFNRPNDPTAYVHLAEVLPRLFKGFFDEPNTAPTVRRPAAAFAVDVHEDDAAYTVVGNLPGFSKDDIKVEIDGNQVNIRAEIAAVADKDPSEATAPKSEASAAARQKVLRSERYVGAFARGFSLPVEIDDAQSAAKYENGVLTLTLPKKPHAAAKRLNIA
jgi:HSP20 family protein